MSDDLLARWRDGDFEAFVRLVEPVIPELRVYAFTHGPRGEGTQDGDDVAQDALIEAFESAPSFDPARGDVRGWLFGILRTRVRRAWQDASRGRERLRRLQEETVQRGLEAPPPAASEPLAALSNCLEKLPEKASQLITATYCENVAAARLADRYGGSESAVYVALHRLRKALRDCIERRLQGEPA